MEQTERRKRVNPTSPATEMVRIHVSFPSSTAKWLYTEAEKRGITLPEVVRRVVDEARQDFITTHARSAQ
jgi:hypothetical protein